MAGILSQVPPRAVFLGAVATLLGVLMFLDRENVKRHYILFYRRTEKGIEYLDRIASISPKFWNFYGWSGVAAAMVSIPAALAVLVYTFYRMVATRSVEQGPSLIAPGVGSEAQFQAGVSFIPAEYWVFGIAILMVVHEMSHGVVARTEGFEINSVGWIVLGIIPGAFVEPKGERMLPGGDAELESGGGLWEQGDWRSRMKVLSAGSFANYLTAGIFFLLAFGLVQAVTVPQTTGYVGILVGETEDGSVQFTAQEGYPVYEAGLRNGTLLEMNGVSIESIDDLGNVSDAIDPGETVTIATASGTVQVEAVERETREVRESLQDRTSFLEWARQFLWMIGSLNLLIGLFNMVPIKPLDGGLIADTLVERYGSELWASRLDAFSAAGWIFLLAAIAASLVGGL